MINVIVFMLIVPNFHRVELFLLICLTQLGIPFNIKIRVNPNNKHISKPIAINNSIKKIASLFNSDQLLTTTL